MTDNDCCPVTGDHDCACCSGAYCEIHRVQPCDCDYLERHGVVLGDWTAVADRIVVVESE